MIPEYVAKDDVFDIVFGEFCACSDETEQVLNDIILQIRELPAISKAHGQWRYWYRNLNDNGYSRCSNCNVDVIGHAKYKYCPHCGAEMHESF